VANFLIK